MRWHINTLDQQLAQMNEHLSERVWLHHLSETVSTKTKSLKKLTWTRWQSCCIRFHCIGQVYLIKWPASVRWHLFSQMTELVMVTLFTPFSLFSGMKGDTKRRLPSITLNLHQNKFETLVLTHSSPRGEICELSYRSRTRTSPHPGRKR